MNRVKCFFDISIAGKAAGKIKFELFNDKVPLTAENFRALCAGDKGIGKSGRPLHFKNNVFHRIIPKFMCQGGDITRGDGSGGESIYGYKFKDESFDIGHDSPGLLSMANSGAGTNGSQFFITTAPCAWLNRKHVVFGKVIEGYGIVEKIEAMGTASGVPKAEVKITNCGELGKESKL